MPVNDLLLCVQFQLTPPRVRDANAIPLKGSSLQVRRLFGVVKEGDHNATLIAKMVCWRVGMAARISK
jgi:hypothetical protein